VDDLPHPILERSGDMRRGFYTVVLGPNVTIANATDYASVHQKGSSRIPKRSMFPDGGLPVSWSTRIDAEVKMALRLL
jgi:hypothetical protein